MFRLLALGVVLVVATPAFAEDKPKPNTLAPKEIAEGWILLFDGETTYGWSAVNSKQNKKVELTAKAGSLVITGKGPESDMQAASTPAVSFTTRFECFELTGEYRTATEGNRLIVALHNSGIVLADNLRTTRGDDWRTFLVRLTPQESIIRLGEGGKSGATGPGFAFGKDVLAEIGFGLSSNDEGRIELRNLKLRPANAKPLFNGKDLTGWSINKADPKRMASKWEVTKDGELSLKTGPGDLVSEKEFDNFVLQLECKSLGKWLNSGVFFRCIPGQYQNGYEAQIHNGFKEDDRTKPIDFGTGAIYRRVPARKVVSNDNEWFTMTVVADGKHIATWVDGYQTVNWIDERPANDNPRNGYRAAKGPLSIQGHDPTTDLLFRNIRIAELPAEKK